MGHVHQFTSYIKVPDGNYSAIHGVLWGPFCAGDRLACQLSVPVAWMPCFGTLRLAQLDQIILQNHLWSHSFLGISLIFLDLVHWFHEFEEKSTGHPFFFLVIFTHKFPLILSGTKRPDCDGERKSDENLGGNG
jgi:hypothetical protein